MKCYVDILYIMIVNGVIISNNKIEMRLVKTANGLSNVKKSSGLKSVRGAGLKILS